MSDLKLTDRDGVQAEALSGMLGAAEREFGHPPVAPRQRYVRDDAADLYGFTYGAIPN
ncbi:MAG: hypothetical protein QF926_01165 [Alphaproteobacteria bacterium]|nr:hypothetical protein [Alphaproteobacteria bacterium]MDP6515219.1 hypothetical protein [Alphaproteobacteria bacterium]